LVFFIILKEGGTIPVCQPIEIEIEGSISDAFHKARKKLSQLGMRLSGYARNGEFSGGGIIGNYSVAGKVLTINITSLRPPASMVYDCTRIEEIIRDFLR